MYEHANWDELAVRVTITVSSLASVGACDAWQQVSSVHVLLHVFSSNNAVSEGVQCDLCALSSLAMTSVTTADRQPDVYLFHCPLKMRYCSAYLRKPGSFV